MLHLFVEAEADEDACGPRRRSMGINRDQPLVDLGDTVMVLSMFLLDHQRRALDVGGEHSLERRGRARRSLLCDIADAAFARDVDAAVIGVVMPRDDFHQRRLARPVAPDQAHARARRQCGSRTVENSAPAKAHGDAVNVEHCTPVAGEVQFVIPEGRADALYVKNQLGSAL